MFDFANKVDLGERIIKCTWHIDFVGAMACGFCLGAWTELVRDDNGFVLANFIWYVLLEMTSFAAAVLILTKWKGKSRCAFGWLVVLLLGSAISFFAIDAAEAISYGQRFMGNAWQSFAFEQFVGWTLAGTIISMPIMIMLRAIYIVMRLWRERALA